jgi:hypothetical protein
MEHSLYRAKVLVVNGMASLVLRGTALEGGEGEALVQGGSEEQW